MTTSKMNQPTLQELYKELAFIAQQNKKIFIGETVKKKLKTKNVPNVEALLFLLQQTTEHKQLINELYIQEQNEILQQNNTTSDDGGQDSIVNPPPSVFEDNPYVYLLDIHLSEDMRIALQNSKRKKATKEQQEALARFLRELQESLQNEAVAKEAEAMQEVIEENPEVADVVIDEISAEKTLQENNYAQNNLPQIIATAQQTTSVYDLETAYQRKAEGEDYVTDQGDFSTSFDDLSKSARIEMLTGDRLYDLSDQEILELCQSLHNTYCEENHIPPCKVSFKDMNDPAGSFTFAEYDVGAQELHINKKLLDFIKICREEGINNEYIGACLLSNIYHESRHRLQFHNIDQEEKTGDYSFVTSMLKMHEGNKALSFAEYFASAEEQDARNAALIEMEEVAKLTKNPKLLEYFRLEQQAEIENCKRFIGSTQASAKKFALDEPSVNHMENIESRLFPTAYAHTEFHAKKHIIKQTLVSDKQMLLDYGFRGLKPQRSLANQPQRGLKRTTPIH